ncbi:MAG: hypothetical protein MJ237_06230 [bacterium]|nr:hypothetical protein [bacterium]
MFSILKYLLDFKPITKEEKAKIIDFYLYSTIVFCDNDLICEYIRSLTYMDVFNILCGISGRNNIINIDFKDLYFDISWSPDGTIKTFKFNK